MTNNNDVNQHFCKCASVSQPATFRLQSRCFQTSKMINFTEGRQRDTIVTTTTREFSRQNTSHAEQREAAKHQDNITATTNNKHHFSTIHFSLSFPSIRTTCSGLTPLRWRTGKGRVRTTLATMPHLYSSVRCLDFYFRLLALLSQRAFT